MQEMKIRLDPDTAQQIGGRDVARIGERLTRRHRPQKRPISVVDARGALGNIGENVDRAKRAALERQRIDEGL